MQARGKINSRQYTIITRAIYLQINQLRQTHTFFQYTKHLTKTQHKIIWKNNFFITGKNCTGIKEKKLGLYKNKSLCRF